MFCDPVKFVSTQLHRMQARPPRLSSEFMYRSTYSVHSKFFKSYDKVIRIYENKNEFNINLTKIRSRNI